MEMESLPTVSQLKSVEQEGLQVEKAGRNKGGWITLPFIVGSVLGLGLATHGTANNLVVYLLKVYNVESINATQIGNIVRGTLNLVPFAAAVVSDSYSGCFPAVIAGTAINVLSLVLFTLSAALPSLRPPRCAAPSSTACHLASPGQLAVLYTAVCLLVIGAGVSRFTVATLGADQFASARDQDAFFNWFFVSLYTSFFLGDTAIVYLQDSVSWALGFGVCIAAAVASLAVLLLGARYYRMPAPKGSPYTGLLRVIFAAVRKARLDVGATGGTARYYLGDGVVADSGSDGAPSNRLRFLNRAAIITASDGWQDASSSGRWRVCTVQQVEDLKALLAVLPVCSSGILLSASIGVKLGMAILQALAMDRSLGPRFKIPAGSIPVCTLVAFIAATAVLERAVFPLWRRITGALPTPLQRIGLGHVMNICGMVAAALVERRRLSTLTSAGEAAAPMSVLWLLIPLGLVGVGEALHFPGNSAFYYQEFPKTLRSMATAMAPLVIALGFYVSTGIVDVVRRVTAWLPANINQGRIDNLYWTVAVMAAVNFGYFLVCACMYKNRRN